MIIYVERDSETKLQIASSKLSNITANGYEIVLQTNICWYVIRNGIVVRHIVQYNSFDKSTIYMLKFSGYSRN